MLPQMASTFLNWEESVQMEVITKKPVAFESVENVDAILTLEMVLRAMSPQKVNRKPEGERIWKWWDGLSDTCVEKDTVVQDPDGRQFRVDSVYDWAQAGFYAFELVQQPYGLGSVSK